MKIYCTVGNYPPFIMGTARSKAKAEQMIEVYKRQDRYSIETDKYPMPQAWEGRYPEYTITK